jgi:Na+(H+)/acetate symporter ActP
VEDDARLKFAPIIFPKGYEGKIQAIEFLGHYLVVVLRYVKEIAFFDMIQCIDHFPNPCK